MSYVTLQDAIPWKEAGLSVVQTATIYVFVLLGLKAVGRRVFGERSPQDLIVLLLIAESCDIGLTHADAGYWGTIASALTILVLGYLSDRISWIDHLLNEKAVLLFRDGMLFHDTMRKHMVEEKDLEEAARQYGVASYHAFSEIMLETGGHITGVLRGKGLRRQKG